MTEDRMIRGEHETWYRVVGDLDAGPLPVVICHGGPGAAHDYTEDSPEYEAAVRLYYDRHLCQVPWPDYVERSFAQMDEDPTVYHTMNGPSEFHCIGSLKTWDITDRLHEISTPTLLVSGRHDEATPYIVEQIESRIPGAQWRVFEDSSHMPHVEEPEAFLEAVEGFLKTVD
jgi:L-proline amide hydrolase